MSQTVNEGVAKRIDEAIKKRGLSYGAVGSRMGVTPTTVWNYAKGNSPPPNLFILTMLALDGKIRPVSR